MKYIKECPQCGKKLRFPLGRGKIRVKCHCGYTSVIDPDDTSLYKNGRFDIEPEKASKKKTFPEIKKLKNIFSMKRIIPKLLNYKYMLQNLKYMPRKEKYRLLILIILPLAFLAFILYFFLVFLV